MKHTRLILASAGQSQLLNAAVACVLLALGLAPNAQAQSLVHDANNRLTRILAEDGSIISYTYDAAGNLVRKVVLARDNEWKLNPLNGYLYRATSYCVTWTACEAEAKRAGGHLATVRSLDENNWLTENFPSPDTQHGYWIGAYDATGLFGWAWSSGEPFTYSNWCCGGPNYQGSELWVYIYYPPNPEPGTWNNAYNDASYVGHIGKGIIEWKP